MNRKSTLRTAIIIMAGVFLVTSFNAPVQAKKTKKKEIIKNTDSQLRLDWFAAHQELAKNSPFKKQKWSHIGPTNVSGRCTDIAAVRPKGENFTIYVATASGGVWKSVNEGTTWEPIFEHEATASIGDIALAPSNQDIIWVGSGEANIFRSSQNGAGIYKSIDAGKTWQHYEQLLIVLTPMKSRSIPWCGRRWITMPKRFRRVGCNKPSAYWVRRPGSSRPWTRRRLWWRKENVVRRKS